MELTNQQIYVYIQNLRSIATKVSGRVAYAVAKNIRKLSAEIVEYENVRDELITKYGEIAENGQTSIQIGSEGYFKFLGEIQEYDDIKQNVDILMLSPDDLYKSDLNADEIMRIDFMISE